MADENLGFYEEQTAHSKKARGVSEDSAIGKTSGEFTSPEADYSAKDIKILGGLDAVRKRPAMYIGDTGMRGLSHLCYEIIDNSIDEVLAGHCQNVSVKLLPDGSAEVEDDGRGIPTELHESGKPAVEVVLTTLHAGGKFDRKSYKISGGLHGVGLSVVNSLSEWLIVRVFRGKTEYMQQYKRGVPLTELQIIGKTDKRGTIMRFKPDNQIFPVTEFASDIIRARLRELAYLNKGVHIKFSDERKEGAPENEEFYYQGGITEFVEQINKNKTPLHKPVTIYKEVDTYVVAITFQYNAGFSTTLYSYVNNINTIEGGTHLVGFKTALTRVLNEYKKNIEKNANGELKITGEDILEGMTGIVSALVPEPQFEGQTKTKLGNSEVKGVVESAVYECVKRYLEENPNDAKILLEKVASSARAREAAQKDRDLVRKKDIFSNTLLPGKLTDCISNVPAECEMFLVEGDSAGGTARQARNRQFQAILPLKGKILNVEKAMITKILDHAEIRAIVTATGAGFGEEFNAEKARYHKIIIMTDADVDGAHIRTLLLTLFYRYMKALIDNGYVYIAQPPLYKISKGKEIHYAFSDDEKDRIIQQIGKPSHIQRYKGLGEMNTDQLWDTTMDPLNRMLYKVTVDDAVKADELLTILMGEIVEPRKEFILANAKFVQNLDI